MARGGGTGKGKLTDFGAIELTTEGGTHYWWNPNDPGGAYLANSVLAQRYPLSYVVGSASHTPTGAATYETSTGVEVQAAALGGKIAVIYGQDRVAADIFFGPAIGGFTGNPGVLTVGFGLGEGEIDSLVKVEKADGTLVNNAPGTTFTGFSAQAGFNFYRGVDAPAAADAYFTSVLTAYGYSFDERYPGLAYVAAQLNFASGVLDAFPDLRWTVKGRKVLDPRAGVDGSGLPNQPAAWSDNPMLCLADYFTNPYYGWGKPLSSIDWASVSTIATWCDAVQSDGRKRFTFNSTLRREASHKANIDFIRSHFRCTYAKVQGKYKFYVDAPAAAVKTFDEGLNCRAVRKWRTPSQQIPNKINYKWTDPSRDYQPATAVDITLQAQAGLVAARPADYNGDGCRNAGQAQSQATYLKNKRCKDRPFHSIVCNRAEGLAMEMYDVCILNLPSFGLSGYYGRIIKIGKLSNGEFLFEFEEYDSAIYGEVIAGTESKPAIGLPNPNGTPPAAPAPTVTQEGFSLKIVVNPLATPYPYLKFQRITVQPAGGAESIVDEVVSGTLYVRGVTMGTAYTIRSYVVSLALVVGAATAVPITPAMAQIPSDIVNGAVTVHWVTQSLPTGSAGLSFGAPLLRSATFYGAGSLTATNLHSYDGAKVNDGATNATAFDWNVSGASRLAFDFGSAKTITEVWVYSSALANDPVFETSDDGVTWSGGSAYTPNITAAIGGGITLRIYRSGLGTSHRYLAMTKGSSAAEASTFTEVWPRETTATVDTSVARYHIYSIGSGGARQYFSTIEAGFEPTVANPFDVNAIASHSPASWPIVALPSFASDSIGLIVTSVSVGGVESPGTLLSRIVGGAASGLLPLDQLTLQGADVASAATTNIGAATGRNVNVTGTTTITAFDTIAAGVERVVKFTGALTLTHNATSLILPGAANIVTAAGDEATFLSLGSGNWRCTSYMRAATAPWSGTIPESSVTNLVADLAAKAPISNPTFTSTATVQTASSGVPAWRSTSAQNSSVWGYGAEDNNQFGIWRFDGSSWAELLTITSTGQVIASAPIRLKGYTVATLPAGTVGMRAYVTDALAPTYGQPVVGGGAVKVPVFFDGTNWITA